MHIEFNLNKTQKFFPTYNIGDISYVELQHEPSMIHCHDHSEAFIPLNNYGYLILGSEVLKMEKPNIYIVPPSIMHAEKNLTEKNNLKYCCVEIPYSVSSIDHSMQKVIILNGNDIFDELFFHIKTCVDIQQTKSESQNTLKILNIYCIYELINSTIKANGYLTTSNKLKYTDSTVEEVIFYIESHFNEQISIEDLAKKLNISHRALTKKFQKTVGISPKHYLMKTKIEQAKKLLSSTDYSISQVCTLCGFDNFAYFTSYFKKYTGLTPSSYKADSKHHN